MDFRIAWENVLSILSIKDMHILIHPEEIHNLPKKTENHITSGCVKKLTLSDFFS